jgi:hypothetical protein
MKKWIATAALAAGAVMGVSMASAGTLDTVKSKGQVVCGHGQGLAGFALPDAQGVWRGLDSDVCRALAAAIFNDPNKVKVVPLTSKDRFTALQSGEIDVLSRNTTWTLSREASLGLEFAGINYYDGQGFMVNKKLNVKSAKELAGATICVQQGTTTELRHHASIQRCVACASHNGSARGRLKDDAAKDTERHHVGQNDPQYYLGSFAHHHQDREVFQSDYLVQECGKYRQRRTMVRHLGRSRGRRYHQSQRSLVDCSLVFSIVFISLKIRPQSPW